MIVVRNERNEYFCSPLQNKQHITTDPNLALTFETEEEARHRVWWKEWETRNNCTAIYEELDNNKAGVV